MKKSKLVGFSAVGLLVALVAWYWASPFFAVASVHNAAVRGDTAALGESVDFASVRQGMSAQLSSVLGERYRDNPLAAMGVALAAEVVVQAIVTPAGIATLVSLQEDEAKKEVSGFALMFARKYTVSREGLGAFEFHRVAEREKKPVLRFSRSGLGWRLAELRIPREVLAEKIRGARR